MSPFSTFRLFVVCVIMVLSSIEAPVIAFALRRTTVSIDSNRDLAQEASVILEVKGNFKGHNDIYLVSGKTNNNTKRDNTFTPTDPPVAPIHNILTINDSKNNSIEQTTNVAIPHGDLSKEIIVDLKGTESVVPVTNPELQTINSVSEADFPPSIYFDNGSNIETTTKVINTSTSNENNISHAEKEDTDRTTGQFNVSTSNILTTVDDSNNKTIKTKQDSMESGTEFQSIYATDKIKEEVTNTIHKSRAMPNWNKYSTIERKRPLPSSEEKISNSLKEKEIVKTEIKQTRITLQDIETSDIPSLEQLKNDLLTSTSKFSSSESLSGGTTKSLPTEHSTTNFTPTTSFTETFSQIGTVESKRAGFLNFSGKTSSVQVTTERENSDFKTNNYNSLHSMFETENPENDAMEDKIGSKTESQRVLNEDAIKEELLKEEFVNDNEENAHRHHVDTVKDSDDVTHLRNINSGDNIVINSTMNYNLSVKPIDVEKTKNTTLYIVNPNYKPLKKIEVLPPKLFIRDPDDNSWRNESLSSLGIVFKPKNSSKPFTEVLKNKTETEWNNMPEKDNKNDIPNLRERLQMMAEKRKSKRKKIDSSGNILYFDYEENSNSVENTNSPVHEIPPTVITASPDLQIGNHISSLATEQPQIVTKMTTQTESVKKIFYTTKKPKSFFDIPEYYDTDEDDSDYLNLAKIDLKKFTTSLRSTTPIHSPTVVTEPPTWLVKKASYDSLPKRKATVQYFPPLTTQKVNINEYDNDFKVKVESFTTDIVLPKSVLPVDTSTAPVTENTTAYNKVNEDLASNYENANKPDVNRDLMLTQPPQTKDDVFAFINSDVKLDRGTYVVKHYKDFINAAGTDSEFEKNAEYVAYTETPMEGATKTQTIRYEKQQAGINSDNVYDYESQFRKDVLQRFVNNFNHNSERYRIDFPILFNNSVIHGGSQDGSNVASSRAFLRGLYNSDIFKPKIGPQKKACEPNCENITVELSPAYELLYYVPEQEEKEEAAPQPVTPPYQYSL